MSSQTPDQKEQKKDNEARSLGSSQIVQPSNQLLHPYLDNLLSRSTNLPQSYQPSQYQPQYQYQPQPQFQRPQFQYVQQPQEYPRQSAVQYVPHPQDNLRQSVVQYTPQQPQEVPRQTIQYVPQQQQEVPRQSAVHYVQAPVIQQIQRPVEALRQSFVQPQPVQQLVQLVQEAPRYQDKFEAYLVESDVDTLKRNPANVKILDNLDLLKKGVAVYERTITETTRVKQILDENNRINQAISEISKEIAALKARGPEVKVVDRVVPKVEEKNTEDTTRVNAIQQDNQNIQKKISELENEINGLRAKGVEVKVVERQIPKTVTKQVLDESKVRSLTDDNQKLLQRLNELDREKAQLLQASNVEVRYNDKVIPQYVDKQVTQYVDKVIVDENKLRPLREDNARLNNLLLERTHDFEILRNKPHEIKYVDKVVYQTQEREVTQYVDRQVLDDSKVRQLTAENTDLQARLTEFVRLIEILRARQPEVKIVERPVVKVVEKVVTEIDACYKFDDGRIKQIEGDNANLNARLIELNKQVDALRNGSNEVVVKVVERVQIDEERLKIYIEENNRLKAAFEERQKELAALRNRPAEIRYNDQIQVQVVEKVFVDENKLRAFSEEGNRLRGLINDRLRELEALKNRQPEIRYSDKEVVSVVEQVVEDKARIQALLEESARLRKFIEERHDEIDHLRARKIEIKYVDRIVNQIIERITPNIIERTVVDESSLHNLHDQNGQLQARIQDVTAQLEQLKLRTFIEIREVEKVIPRIVDKPVVQYVEKVVVDENKIKALLDDQSKLRARLNEAQNEHLRLTNLVIPPKIVEKEVIQIVEKIIPQTVHKDFDYFTHQVRAILEDNVRLNVLISERQREVELWRHRQQVVRVVERIVPVTIERVSTQIVEKPVEDLTRVNQLLAALKQKDDELNELRNKPEQIVYKEVIVPKEKIVYKEVEVPKEKIVYREVEVPVKLPPQVIEAPRQSTFHKPDHVSRPVEYYPQQQQQQQPQQPQQQVVYTSSPQKVQYVQQPQQGQYTSSPQKVDYMQSPNGVDTAKSNFFPTTRASFVGYNPNQQQ